ncbi:MAG: hypothetical protein ACYTG0_25900 [Planctomycetota bacterium]|jgi:hypothetical protein
MATARPSVGPIHADVSYPLPVFKGLIGVDDWAWQQITKNGFQPVKIGRRKYVLGSDWHRYLRKQAAKQQANGNGDGNADAD